jgi:A/G-specific adenine glycosylase
MGLRGGDPQQFPRPRRPAKVKTIDRLAVAIQRKQRWLLLKRPLNGLWAGMWEFPQLAPERSVPIEGLVREKFGLEVRMDGRFATFSHTLTHRKVNFKCYRAHAVSGRLRRDEYQHHRWIRADAMGTMPMAAYGDKMVKLMQDALFIDR